MEYSPKKIKELLDKYNFNLKKGLGQNFIIDENTINNIISKAEIDADTLVLEIGPGAGALTYKLSNVAQKVICYEIDPTLKEILEVVLSDKNNVKVIYEDFLKANVLEMLKKETYKKLYVVANLPYYITTPIIIKLIEDEIPVDKIVVMVQKEVGDRFKSKPGSKSYGSLTVFLNYYFDITKISDVSKNVFMPKPNVDSIVVAFKRKQSPLKVKNKPLFFKIIKDSFRQKRKTLRNNLIEYNLDIVKESLTKYKYDLSVRAEQLSLEVFIDIANDLSDASD